MNGRVSLSLSVWRGQLWLTPSCMHQGTVAPAASLMGISTAESPRRTRQCLCREHLKPMSLCVAKFFHVSLKKKTHIVYVRRSFRFVTCGDTSSLVCGQLVRLAVRQGLSLLAPSTAVRAKVSPGPSRHSNGFHEVGQRG